MTYMGSKREFAKELLPIICKDLKRDQWYVEPFVGGANMIDKLVHPYKIGADVNPYLIALLQHVQAGGELPKFISYEQFYEIKKNKDYYPQWLVGYNGIVCSSMHQWGKGYAKNSFSRYSNDASFNISQERATKVLKAQNLRNIKFICSDYRALDIPPNSIIYCDPPYQYCTKYRYLKNDFDTDAFWSWAKDKAKEGHQVFVSEFEGPPEWECIWSKPKRNRGLINSRNKTEKLFTLK